MSEVNSGTIKCIRCKHVSERVLRKTGTPFKTCVACREYVLNYNRWYLANESADHHTARMATVNEKYRTDEVYRERRIKAASAYSETPTECPECLKKMRRGSLLPHLKICGGFRVPTVRESILSLG